MGKRKKPTSFPDGSVEAVTLSVDERERVAALLAGDKELPSPGVGVPPLSTDAGARSIEAEARQSELRFDNPSPPPPKRDPFERLGLDELESKAVDALEAFLTEDERTAPYAAVLTPEQLGAILDDKAADDGPRYDEAPVPVHTPGARYEAHSVITPSPLWMSRLQLMATEEGVTPTEYAEFLIRRQWVARPLAGKVRR